MRNGPSLPAASNRLNPKLTPSLVWFCQKPMSTSPKTDAISAQPRAATKPRHISSADGRFGRFAIPANWVEEILCGRCGQVGRRRRRDPGFYCSMVSKARGEASRTHGPIGRSRGWHPAAVQPLGTNLLACISGGVADQARKNLPAHRSNARWASGRTRYLECGYVAFDHRGTHSSAWARRIPRALIEDLTTYSVSKSSRIRAAGRWGSHAFAQTLRNGSNR